MFALPSVFYIFTWKALCKQKPTTDKCGSFNLVGKSQKPALWILSDFNWRNFELLFQQCMYHCDGIVWQLPICTEKYSLSMLTQWLSEITLNSIMLVYILKQLWLVYISSSTYLIHWNEAKCWSYFLQRYALYKPTLNENKITSEIECENLNIDNKPLEIYLCIVSWNCGCVSAQEVVTSISTRVLVLRQTFPLNEKKISPPFHSIQPTVSFHAFGLFFLLFFL